MIINLRANLYSTLCAMVLFEEDITLFASDIVKMPCVMGTKSQKVLLSADFLSNLKYSSLLNFRDVVLICNGMNLFSLYFIRFCINIIEICNNRYFV